MEYNAHLYSASNGTTLQNASDANRGAMDDERSNDTCLRNGADQHGEP